MSRVERVQKSLMAFLEELFPEWKWERSYTPTYVIHAMADGETVGMVCLEDIVTERNNSNGTKFTDIFTFTIALVHKLADKINAIPEVDAKLSQVEQLRDVLRFRTSFSDGFRLVVLGAEHSASRPIYDRQTLEEQNIFIGFLLLEVRVNGSR